MKNVHQFFYLNR